MGEPAGGGGDVLTALDERKPSGFYWQLTLLATLGGFLFGYDTSNIGSALNFVPYGRTGFAEGTWSRGRPSEPRSARSARAR